MIFKKRIKYQEFANCITHLIGLMAAITFAAILITQS